MQTKFINQIEPLITNKDKKNIIEYLNTGGWITEHSQNKLFEEKFKKITNSKYAITFPNGTLTLYGILLSLNIKKGDEIIIPSYTMVATANSVILTGARVIFCDISSENLCLDPIKLKEKITKKTKAVIYVTLNGRSGYINQIKNICKKKKLFMIEDSAHSIGSFYKKKHHGNFSIASSFSFSMPKIVTTGQGGMIVTNNKSIYNKIKSLKNFGRKSDGNDTYKAIGYNFKFTDLQAALGISQLKTLKNRVLKKREIFKLYYNNLSTNPKIEMLNFEKNETPWFVDIYVSNRALLKKYLFKHNISTRYVYPSLDSLKIFNKQKKLVTSNHYCSRGLWLPSSLNLTKYEIQRISKLILDFYK